MHGEMTAVASAMAAGVESANSALYFPWLNVEDPLEANRLRPFPPCGFVAGVYARTDSLRGVWKAPAGVEARVTGAAGTQIPLSEDEIGRLIPFGVNCIRPWRARGPVLWGSRTLQGNEVLGSDWKSMPVRRFALFIKESILRGTGWVVFEPNNERQGSSPPLAYFVKCDQATTTASDIVNGVCNILNGVCNILIVFAPLRPGEFVVIGIQQHTA